MKIQSSVIAMSSKSSLVESHSKEESLKMWTGNKRPDFESQNAKSNSPSQLQLDILELSEKAKKALESQKKDALAAANASTGAASTGEADFELSDKDMQKIKMLIDMIERLTGKKMTFKIPDLSKLKESVANINSNTNSAATAAAPAAAQKPAGWGLEYDSHETHYEQQKMSFSAEGIIKTADGKEINFSVDVNMSREFYSQQDISLRAGDGVNVDPLVINFDGNAASLTTTKFSFDLDSDGKEDQISFAGSGSGFLALDSSGDGKINDGSELFGPQSGNGFSELAKYDSDSNNWIDENDPIFNKLRIWTKDEAGNDQLFAIGEKGIGAIYLGNVDTNFALKDQNNTSQGEIQKTGIFVKENGSVGTIQHIDLAI